LSSQKVPGPVLIRAVCLDSGAAFIVPALSGKT
jgi:hypothetical protein